MQSKNLTLGSSLPRIESQRLNGLTLAPVVSELASLIGQPLLPHQEYVFDQALQVDAKGKWIRKTVGVEIARQQGKTHMMRMRILTGLYIFGEQNILGMAQNLDMAIETLEAVAEVIEENEVLHRRLKRHLKKNGGEKLEIWCEHWPKDCPTKSCKRVRNYLVKAANPKAARGKSIDLLYIDELREITEAAWAAALPTTTSRPNAQIYVTSNAGDLNSQVLNDLRTRALTNQSPALGWLEWSADPNCKIDDRQGWAQANPALGTLTTWETLENFYNTLSPEKFRTEHLCQQVDSIDSPWDLAGWDSGFEPELLMEDNLPTYAGVDFNFARDEAYLTIVQSVGDDYRVFVEGWIAQERRALDERQIASEIANLTRQWKIKAIAYDDKAAGHVAQHLQRGGIKMIKTNWASSEFAMNCDQTRTLMFGHRLKHQNNQVLREQLAASARVHAGDGGWRVSRKGSGSIPAAVSMILAVGLADKPQVQPRSVVM